MPRSMKCPLLNLMKVIPIVFLEIAMMKMTLRDFSPFGSLVLKNLRESCNVCDCFRRFNKKTVLFLRGVQYVDRVVLSNEKYIFPTC